MPLVQVVVGNKVAAADLNQIVQALTGSIAHPITLFGSYAAATYALTVWNTGTDGLIGLFKTNAGNILKVTKDGVRLSPDGVNFDLVPVTSAGAIALTNKSIDGTLNTITNLAGSSFAGGAIPETAIATGAISTRTLAADSVTGVKLGTAEGAFLRKTVSQGMPSSGTTYTVLWDSEEWDSNTLHDNVTNSSRITIKVAGLYVMNCAVFIDDASGAQLDDVHIKLKKNGSNFQDLEDSYPNQAINSGNLGRTHTFFTRCVIGDYFELTARRGSGSSSCAIETTSWFMMKRESA